MATDAGTPVRQKKKRVDLAAYYQAVQESSTPTVFRKPEDEEAPKPKDAFNPQAFLSNILRTQSLKELLETDSAMIKGTCSRAWRRVQRTKTWRSFPFPHFPPSQAVFANT